ncbi:MAG: ribonuclease III [Patescibacteria group bacterium]|nr:ribonuclease III [Patescibacteria group bacterium]MDD5490854.1 ribonuclease III [Patescibacteria group bacterium]
MKDLSKFEKKIGLAFKNQDYLKQSLVHRSYINEHPSFDLGHNERLEFLGDAVLELIVTEYLYNNYANPEGDLTNWRASLVNAKMLSEIARELDLEDYLYLSRGEAKDRSSKARQFILADALEALVGAIYLDQGMKKAKEFLKKHLLGKLSYILEHKLYLDPKSKFQELSQEKFGITPVYKVLEESGPDHDKRFVVGVYLGKEKIAAGEGSSKQEAQIEAAARALEKKNW